MISTEHAILTTFLLRLVPNLENTLILAARYTRTELFQDANGSLMPPLLALKDLTLSRFRSPFRRRHLPQPAPDHDEPQTAPPSSQPLRELILTKAHLTITAFTNLLTTIGPHLTKVTIHRADHSERGLPNADVEFHQLVTALQPWKSTLKELSFLLTEPVVIRRTRRLDGTHLLRNFTALEILEVHALAFDFVHDWAEGGRETVLSGTLPPGLRRLNAVEVDEQAYDLPYAKEMMDMVGLFGDLGIEFVMRARKMDQVEGS
ncbi:hypothetical protein N0V88_006574 [Collariella sp. IMI 366227]|nr:hypothetical protein N0V88_006574 [Collariella sp. IMI 366227]